MVCMKKIIWFVIGIFFLWLCDAQTVVDPMNFSKLDRYVNDFSKVLDEKSLAEINWLAQSYDKITTNQIVTVLFPSRQWNELFDIGMKLFRENKIGQKDKNNGLLLVIATDEKKIRIIVWYGLEGVIPDVKARDIIEEKVRPRVNSGDYAQAVKNFYTASAEAIWTGQWNESMQGSDQDDSEWYGVWLALGWLIAVIVFSLSRSTLAGAFFLSWISSLFAYFLDVAWLGGDILAGFLFGLIFTLIMFSSGGSRGGWWRSSGWWFSGGWFSGGGWSSGGWGAWD